MSNRETDADRRLDAEAMTSVTLLDRLRSSDEEGWRRTLYLYTPLVTYWCRRQGIRPEDAEDVAQEVFRSVASGIGDFRRDRPGDTFRGWLRGVTRNKALDWHRQRGRQPAEASGGTEAALMIQGVPEGIDDGGDDEPQQKAGLYRRALELVQGEFEGKTWTAFWQVTVDGHPVADVAKDLGVSPAAIRQAKSRVLRRLREEVGDLID